MLKIMRMQFYQLYLLSWFEKVCKQLHPTFIMWDSKYQTQVPY